MRVRIFKCSCSTHTVHTPRTHSHWPCRMPWVVSSSSLYTVLLSITRVRNLILSCPHYGINNCFYRSCLRSRMTQGGRRREWLIFPLPLLPHFLCKRQQGRRGMLFSSPPPSSCSPLCSRMQHFFGLMALPAFYLDALVSLVISFKWRASAFSAGKEISRSHNTQWSGSSHHTQFKCVIKIPQTAKRQLSSDSVEMCD